MRSSRPTADSALAGKPLCHRWSARPYRQDPRQPNNSRYTNRPENHSSVRLINAEAAKDAAVKHMSMADAACPLCCCSPDAPI